MWHKDDDGVELRSAADAFEHLRSQTQRAIDYADEHGIELRSLYVRLRDEAGNLLFEGTLGEASNLQFGSDSPMKDHQRRELKHTAVREGLPHRNQAVQLTEVDANTLQVTKQQLDTVVRAGSDVIYRMSADWSEMRILEGNGFIPDTTSPHMAWLDTYIPPEDRLPVLGHIEQAIRGKTVFSLEHRVIRGDGSLGWTRSCAVPIINANGEIQEWFGAADDITARRQAEAQPMTPSTGVQPSAGSADVAGCRTVIQEAIGDWFRQQPSQPFEDRAIGSLAKLIEQRLAEAGMSISPKADHAQGASERTGSAAGPWTT